MRRKLKKIFSFVKDISLHLGKNLSLYIFRSCQSRQVGPYLKCFLRSSIFQMNQLLSYLYKGGIEHYKITENKIKKLQKTVLGLHSLLPRDEQFSYSLLMAVNAPSPIFFQESLESAFNQSAPSLEILIGLMEPLTSDLKKVLFEITQKHPGKFQLFEFFHENNPEAVVNRLAETATGSYLLIVGDEDWIRPDLLFRFEQTLRIFPNPEKKVLYCNLNAINAKGFFIPRSEYCQPKKLAFPYFFKPFNQKGMLFPTALWRLAGGLNLNRKGAEYENLLLQLDLAGASFQHIPFSLYSSRFSAEISSEKSQKNFLTALEHYSQAKPLDWKWEPGCQDKTVRAIPPLPKVHSIQVIVPYKDQKELTMKCIYSLLKQKGVRIVITAVDNQSQDPSIAEGIEELGGEVISVQEPFNYSRLNNLAVKMTKKAAHCNVILFLNNDVELEPDAIGEMLRWIDQPRIGMVGCRLHYPDGRLQHGGVSINYHGRDEMRWEHVEKLRSFEEMHVTKTAGVFDAVTAACAMVKRRTFLEVGGFDETWYPIGYSDTNLAVKIVAKGLKCFYTPYATGIHHESVSRSQSIEDFENSWWLHNLLIDQGRI